MAQPEEDLPCPRCSYPLQVIDLQQSTFDICHRCGGKFVPPRALAAHYGDSAKPSAWVQRHIAQDLGSRPLRCPHDAHRLHAFSIKLAVKVASDDAGDDAGDPNGAKDEVRPIEIDACPACHGLFFDRGEGDRLVDLIAHADQRQVEAELAAHSTRAYLFQLFTSLPMEVYNPIGKRALVVPLLIALNTLVFLLEVSQPDLRTVTLAWGWVPAAPRPTTIITHMFMHASWLHLLGNMYSLYIFGDNIEDRYGHVRFLICYLVCGLAAAGLHFLASMGSPVPMVGASGAIAGLMGAYLVAYPRTHLWMVLFFVRFKVPVYVFMAFWIGIQILGAASGLASIAWWAHLGGFAAGLGFGFWFSKTQAIWKVPTLA